MPLNHRARGGERATKDIVVSPCALCCTADAYLEPLDGQLSKLLGFGQGHLPKGALGNGAQHLDRIPRHVRHRAEHRLQVGQGLVQLRLLVKAPCAAAGTMWTPDARRGQVAGTDVWPGCDQVQLCVPWAASGGQSQGPLDGHTRGHSNCTRLRAGSVSCTLCCRLWGGASC